MKHKKLKQIPASEREVITHITCDICKLNDEEVDIDIDSVNMEFNEEEINCPGYQKGTLHTYDICSECFIDKVMPMMLGLGAEPTSVDYSR